MPQTKCLKQINIYTHPYVNKGDLVNVRFTFPQIEYNYNIPLFGGEDESNLPLVDKGSHPSWAWWSTAIA